MIIVEKSTLWFNRAFKLKQSIYVANYKEGI